MFSSTPGRASRALSIRPIREELGVSASSAIYGVYFVKR